MPAGASEGKKTERMGVGEWMEPRRPSGGFSISPKDAQILRLGSQPWPGQILQTPQCCSFVPIAHVFHSTEQKLHCYAFGTFHEPQVFYLKPKPKLLLLSAGLAGHPLQVSEWKQGRPRAVIRPGFRERHSFSKCRELIWLLGLGKAVLREMAGCKPEHHPWTGHGGGGVVVVAECSAVRPLPTVMTFSSSVLAGSW